MKSLKDPIRRKYIDLFTTEVNDQTIALKLEQSIYNMSIYSARERCIKRRWDNVLFHRLYVSKIRSVYSNISETSYIQNPDFKQKLLSGEIDPNKLDKLSVYDIYPDNWSELLDKKIQRDKLKYEMKPTAMTDQFKCRKCGSRSCSYYEVQTRSADEPMTQFITCLECNNRWKQ
tara:strand:- start:175 stop:696 length:522 start_codon:yes stop_codon:yes gene_type:complete